MNRTLHSPDLPAPSVVTTGWLQCAYQPVVDRDDRVVRFEALLRPHGGAPDAVLALHRPGRSRTALTLAILDRVLADQARIGLPVAVNVDAADVALVAELVAVWTSTGRVDPSRLAVEVVEHARPDRDGFAAMAWLVDLGYSVAFDDVGTGCWVPDDLGRVPGADVKVAPELWRFPSLLVGWFAAFDGHPLVVEGVEAAADLPDWADLWQGFAAGRPAPVGHWADR